MRRPHLMTLHHRVTPSHPFTTFPPTSYSSTSPPPSYEKSSSYGTPRPAYTKLPIYTSPPDSYSSPLPPTSDEKPSSYETAETSYAKAPINALTVPHHPYMVLSFTRHLNAQPCTIPTPIHGGDEEARLHVKSKTYYGVVLQAKSFAYAESKECSTPYSSPSPYQSSEKTYSSSSYYGTPPPPPTYKASETYSSPYYSSPPPTAYKSPEMALSPKYYSSPHHHHTIHPFPSFSISSLYIQI
ncbi:hypothetical protein Cgig2_016099 [Carnegiea gigantea]|uniref:Uncharacterized protein n=1 Tax=Carnegiea gigantea TaxID=171969 RepID=A0A9Q1QM25_9CARY|nr:hypothetical protein Cgig2_016099 [Carnegiea gigantea]